MLLDEELKTIWQNASKEELVKLNKTKLLLDMGSCIKKIENDIKQRDKREIGAAAILIPVFLVISYFVPNVTSKIGAALVVPWCVFIIYKLKKVKKNKKEENSLSLQEYLLEYKNYLEKQKNLLDTVLYWDILPCFVCICLFFAGLKHYELIVLTIFVCAAVYYLNKKAVRTYFKPLLEKIDKSIAELTKDLTN